MTPAEAERTILAIADDVECDFAGFTKRDADDGRSALPAYLRRQARRLREAVAVLRAEHTARTNTAWDTSRYMKD